jgi:hypothetical protein
VGLWPEEAHLKNSATESNRRKTPRAGRAAAKAPGIAPFRRGNHCVIRGTRSSLTLSFFSSPLRCLNNVSCCVVLESIHFSLCTVSGSSEIPRLGASRERQEIQTQVSPAVVIATPNSSTPSALVFLMVSW